jgi:hypothetical protein
MAHILYLCENCNKMTTLSSGALVNIPFNRLPQLVLEADRHKCIKKEAA